MTREKVKSKAEEMRLDIQKRTSFRFKMLENHKKRMSTESRYDYRGSLTGMFKKNFRQQILDNMHPD